MPVINERRNSEPTSSFKNRRFIRTPSGGVGEPFCYAVVQIVSKNSLFKAEIHQAQLSQVSLPAEFFIGKVPLKEFYRGEYHFRCTVSSAVGLENLT